MEENTKQGKQLSRRFDLPQQKVAKHHNLVLDTMQEAEIGFQKVGGPHELVEKLNRVGYHCMHYLAVQIALLLNTPTESRIRALFLDGPSCCVN